MTNPKKSSIKKFSTLGFILTSIGCAVGLGNIWRFPQKMVESGGTAFIIVYIFALLLIVLPIIFLEMQYGLFFKRDPIRSFEHAGGNTGRFFAWKQIFITGFLCLYYFVIVGWVATGFFTSLTSFSKMSAAAGSEDFFSDTILKEGDLTATQAAGKAPVIGLSFSMFVFFGGLGILVLTVLVLWQGAVKGLSIANMIVVPLFFLLIVVLTFYAVFGLKRSGVGLRVLFDFNPEPFRNFSVWYQATTQAVFSTGALFGTFIILSRNSDIRVDKGNDALLIVVADTLIGVLSGILVTSIIASKIANANPTANIAELQTKIKEAFQSSSGGGPTLVFTELPRFFGTLGSPLGIVLCASFFLTLLFAAFSSLICLVEVFVQSLSSRFSRLTRKKSILFFFLFALMGLLFYSTSFGSSLTGEQDNIIVLGALVIGIVQVSLFSYYRHAGFILRQNQRYSYIKLGKGNALLWLSRIIVIPVIVILSIYGIMSVFGIGALIANNVSEAKKDVLKNIFGADFIKPFKFTIANIVSFSFLFFMTTISLFCFLVSKRIKDIKKKPNWEMNFTAGELKVFELDRELKNQAEKKIFKDKPQLAKIQKKARIKK